MPVGILVNASCILVGGLIGGAVGHHIPERIRKSMMLVFGIAAMGLAITLVMKYHSIPVVVLSLLIGTIIGEFLNLEKRIGSLCDLLRRKLTKTNAETGAQQDNFMDRFLAVLALFCFSGTGIFGSLNEGMTGDPTVMITKGILDFFTALIFAASLGYLVAFISFPQCAIFCGLFFCASFIIPLTTPEMLGDFSAVGGLTTLAVGLRIAEIKPFKVLNMLPSFVIALPLSALWTLIFP